MKTLSRSKKCLFGGTILAAGLTAQTAQAQMDCFVIDSSYALTHQSDGNYSVFSGPGNFAISSTSNDGAQSGKAWANGNSIGSTASSAGQGWSQGIVFYSFFHVTSNLTAVGSWDFTADQTYGQNYNVLFIYDVTNSTLLAYQDWNSGSGSVNIPLSTGVQYFAEIFSTAANGGGTTYGQIICPTPASAALLGLGGLVAARRRRE